MKKEVAGKNGEQITIEIGPVEEAMILANSKVSEFMMTEPQKPTLDEEFEDMMTNGADSVRNKRDAYEKAHALWQEELKPYQDKYRACCDAYEKECAEIECKLQAEMSNAS